MTAALEGVSGQQHTPAALYPRVRPGTHFTGGIFFPIFHIYLFHRAEIWCSYFLNYAVYFYFLYIIMLRVLAEAEFCLQTIYFGGVV